MYLFREKKKQRNLTTPENIDGGYSRAKLLRAIYIMVFIRREDQASVCRKVKKTLCLNLNKKYNTKTGVDKHKKQ